MEWFPPKGEKYLTDEQVKLLFVECEKTRLMPFMVHPKDPMFEFVKENAGFIIASDKVYDPGGRTLINYAKTYN